ncbi:hypothetical protein B0H14DRAFT_3490662 [Mycena olivaceomarginata]|nr:hypothetical protein B0H14DRAFT_3490662 [Mycena olivaceomarginata]
MAKRAKKKERSRVPKEERKNLRLWAEGAREEILTPHLDAYAAALNQGWQPERKYLKTPVLGEWDPSVILPQELLSEDDERRKRERIKLLNARIRRWFVYRIRRLRKHRHSAGLDPTKDPFAVLLAKLSGLSAPPKARQAFQQYMRECYDDSIAPVVADRWADERSKDSAIADRTKELKAGFRAQVARELFADLPSDEQKVFGERAKKQAAEAKAAYLSTLNSPPPATAEARQNCIANLHNFVGPILQGIHGYTGLHATLIVGGPMPSQGGELGTLHFSYGRNKAALSQHWGQWDKARFTNNVQNFMVDYLKTAYTAQDCLDAALPSTGGLDGARYVIETAQEDVSDSDSDLDSESDSDSDTDLDEEHTARTRKKRKTEGLGTAQPTARAKGKRKAIALSAVTTSAAAIPPPTSSTAASSSAIPSAPQETPAPEDNRMDDESDAHSGEDPELPPLWTGHISEAERQQNIARNQALLQGIKDDFRALETEVTGKPPRAPRKPREKKLRLEPTRRSTRQALAPSSSPPPPAASSPPLSSVPPAPSVSAPSAPLASAPPVASASAPPAPSSAPLPPAASAPPLSSATLTQMAREVPPISQAVQVAMAAPPSPTPADESSLLGPCPTGAPTWFVDARRQMTAVGLGCHFDALLAAWTRIEDASRFEQGRPICRTRAVRSRSGFGLAAPVGGNCTTPRSPTSVSTRWYGRRGGTLCSRGGGRKGRTEIGNATATVKEEGSGDRSINGVSTGH